MATDKHIYPEEKYAKELYKRLKREPFVSELNAKLTVSGAGVHWHCSVSRNAVLSEINCFDEGVYGPQYLTYFRSKDEIKAVLRTNSIEETISSVSIWLHYSDVEILYKKHPFVDKSKRNLTTLHHLILELNPTLAQKTNHQLSSRFDEFYDLMFLHGNRSCVISAADHFQNHLVSFKEDQVEMCSFREKNPNIIAQALNSWLIGGFSPTTLGRKFDGLTFSEVAIYYEIGKPVIGEFIQSWNFIERFFLSQKNLESAQAYGLVVKMREAGYDKTLRAGQSLMTLILSRSRRHGLQKGQSHIYFDFHNNIINVRCSFSGEEVQEFKFPYYASKELSPELINILDTLVAYPIT